MHDNRSASHPIAGDAAAGNAALAARRLGTSEDHSLSPYRGLGERQYRDLGERQLAALQGIGYALLAIADHLADATDTAADAAAHLEQLALTADELAAPRHRPRRAWLRAWRRCPTASGMITGLHRPQGPAIIVRGSGGEDR
jgi:hypothetical protein